MFTYKKDVFELLEQNGYTQYWSAKNGNILGNRTLQKLKNKDNVQLKTMALCAGLLKCHIGDLWDVDENDPEIKALLEIDHPISDKRRTGRKTRKEA